MRVDHHLVLDRDSAEYAVDLSNVVRDRELPDRSRPADLSRLHALIHALIDHSRHADVRVYAVADWSLLRLGQLSDEERAVLRRWFRAGRIEVLDHADDRLLELADDAGLMVVSTDGYQDYARQYPWLGGNRDRFLRAVPGPGGRGVAVVPRIMPSPLDAEISQRIEQHELLANGLYDRRGGTGPRRDLLSRRWRCAEPDCPLFGPAERDFQPLPRFRNEVAVCPTHNRPLTAAGTLPRRIQIKIRIAGAVRRRFVLLPGRSVAVGRAPGAGGIALAADLAPLPAARAEELSRSHAVLHWTGWQLTVQDTSRNGTRIRTGRAGAPDRALIRGQSARVRPGHEIVLVEGLELLPSGRQFTASDGEMLEPGAPGAALPEAFHAATALHRIGEPWLPGQQPVPEGRREDRNADSQSGQVGQVDRVGQAAEVGQAGQVGQPGPVDQPADPGQTPPRRPRPGPPPGGARSYGGAPFR